MRSDRNKRIFIMHTDWYTFELPKGYIPTEKAPKEAVEAMARYNEYAYKNNTENVPR